MKKIACIALLLIGSTMGRLMGQTENTEPIRFSHVNRDRAAMKDLYLHTYVPARDHAEGWVDKGNCQPGTLPAATLKARLQELNYFRKMAGVHAVTLNPEFNELAQAAAFLMRQNGTLNHHPPTNWKCYTEKAAKGAGSCNLGYGGGIIGYMEDYGSSNQDCGHRMWILSAEKEQLGYGGTDATDAIYVFGGTIRRDSLPEYVAWPPAGFVPAEIIDNRWTISVPQGNARYDHATVTVSADGKNLPLVYQKATYYGDGGIAFELQDYQELEARMLDKKIKVSVKGIEVGDKILQFNYEVVLFKAEDEPVYATNADDEVEVGERVEFTLVEADPTEDVVVPFAEQACLDVAPLTQDSAMARLAFQTLRSSAVRDLVCNREFCAFAAKVSALRRDKNPEAAKLLAWAESKIKQHLAHKAGLTPEQAAAAYAPKFLLVEVKQLVPLDGSMRFEDIAVALTKKFVADPELSDFTQHNKYIRQGGIGLSTKRVLREGKAYAGVYATLVIAPSKLRMAS